MYEAAPAQIAGTASPSDGGRSTTLLILAFAALAGAGVVTVLAIRTPSRRATPAPVGVTPVKPVAQAAPPAAAAQEPSSGETVERALTAMAAGGEDVHRERAAPSAGESADRGRRFRRAGNGENGNGGRFKRPWRIKAARATAIEASASARRGMPLIVEPPSPPSEPVCIWRPRVVPGPPPLPAFGPGAGSGPPTAPPPPN